MLLTYNRLRRGGQLTRFIGFVRHRGCVCVCVCVFTRTFVSDSATECASQNQFWFRRRSQQITQRWLLQSKEERIASANDSIVNRLKAINEIVFALAFSKCDEIAIGIGLSVVVVVLVVVVAIVVPLLPLLNWHRRCCYRRRQKTIDQLQNVVFTLRTSAPDLHLARRK